MQNDDDWSHRIVRLLQHQSLAIQIEWHAAKNSMVFVIANGAVGRARTHCRSSALHSTSSRRSDARAENSLEFYWLLWIVGHLNLKIVSWNFHFISITASQQLWASRISWEASMRRRYLCLFLWKQWFVYEMNARWHLCGAKWPFIHLNCVPVCNLCPKFDELALRGAGRHFPAKIRYHRRDAETF